MLDSNLKKEELLRIMTNYPVTGQTHASIVESRNLLQTRLDEKEAE